MVSCDEHPIYAATSPIGLPSPRVPGLLLPIGSGAIVSATRWRTLRGRASVDGDGSRYDQVMGQRTLFTVGHSTRAWTEFVILLKVWEIEELVDVRTVPRSRTFPWFDAQRMERALRKSAISYVHIAALGGFREPKRESVNAGWRNARFRAYADYMQTEEFEEGLRELNERRRERRVCVMCSEAVWWRCHRRMIADAEVARGIAVKHVMSETVATRHELTGFAVVRRMQKRGGGAPVITYPGVSEAIAIPRKIRR